MLGSVLVHRLAHVADVVHANLCILTICSCGLRLASCMVVYLMCCKLLFAAVGERKEISYQAAEHELNEIDSNKRANGDAQPLSKGGAGDCWKSLC